MRSDPSGIEGEKQCFECHDSEHLEKECPNPICYRCDVRGHRFYNCTKINSKNRGYRRFGRSLDYRRNGHSRLYYERSPPRSGAYEYASKYSGYRDSNNKSPDRRSLTYRRDGQGEESSREERRPEQKVQIVSKVAGNSSGKFGR